MSLRNADVSLDAGWQRCWQAMLSSEPRGGICGCRSDAGPAAPSISRFAEFARRRESKKWAR